MKLNCRLQSRTSTSLMHLSLFQLQSLQSSLRLHVRQALQILQVQSLCYSFQPLLPSRSKSIAVLQHYFHLIHIDSTLSSVTTCPIIAIGTALKLSADSQSLPYLSQAQKGSGYHHPSIHRYNTCHDCSIGHQQHTSQCGPTVIQLQRLAASPLPH